MNVGFHKNMTLQAYIWRVILCFFQRGNRVGHGHCGLITYIHETFLTLSGPGYLMSLKVRGGGGGTCAPPLISKSANSILMTLYSTLYKNCSHYRSAICFKMGLGLAEIIRCLCTKVLFL